MDSKDNNRTYRRGNNNSMIDSSMRWNINMLSAMHYYNNTLHNR